MFWLHTFFNTYEINRTVHKCVRNKIQFINVRYIVSHDTMFYGAWRHSGAERDISRRWSTDNLGDGRTVRKYITIN